MKSTLNIDSLKRYKSNPQKIRVASEYWVGKYIYCPSCGSNLLNYKNNNPVGDFYCQNCSEDFELKSKQRSFGNKIVDGAYDTMISRLKLKKSPHFFLLNYNPINFEIINFLAIPTYFFTDNVIEKRKPLSPTARRAGWIGCNILIKDIPESGKIYYIKNLKSESKNEILEKWKKTSFLKEEKLDKSKGWIIDIISCVEKINKKEFTLNEIYSFEKLLSIKHPNNKFVKDKIRQQLQVLRDKGFLEFKQKGVYRLL